MKKKILALALTLVIVLAAAPLPAYAFSDMEQGDVLTAAQTLQMMGVIDGYPDGGLHPGDVLTRAQFAKMTIALMGQLESAKSYGSFTIYPDVRSSHWAVSYVNYSVRSENKFMTGYPNGYYGPDVPITFGQAVTILMRVLGYTDAELGYNWPYGYIGKARELGLLDGISLTADQSINRGAGVLLFRNLLTTNIKGSSQPYISSRASLITSATILAVNERTASGKTNGVLYYAGGQMATVVPIRSMSPNFIGMSGTLALDTATGELLTFVPDKLTAVNMIVAKASYTAIESVEGRSFDIAENIYVIYDKSLEAYEDVWYAIVPGMSVTVYLNADGSVSHLALSTASSTGEVGVLSGSGAGALASLGSLSGVSIYKNGAPATADDARAYDVVVYDRSAKTLNMTDNRLTGVYENVYPNMATPVRVTILGREFSVLPQAVSQVAKFRPGDRITLLLTPDFKVAGAVSADVLSAVQLGILKNVGATSATVALFNGLEITSGINSDFSRYTGRVVRISSSGVGKISVSPVSERAATANLDLVNMKMGSANVAGSVRIFDTIGDYALMAQVELKDITLKSIPASAVRHYETDYAGRVSLIILKDVTGDLYSYGRMFFTKGKDPAPINPSDPDSEWYSGVDAVISLVNGDGTASISYSYQRPYLPDNIIAGVAADKNGVYAGHIELKRHTGINRYDFTDRSVKINGLDVPLASKLQVYNKTLDIYTTLELARAFSERFEVYTDKDINAGGKVRYIVAL